MPNNKGIIYVERLKHIADMHDGEHAVRIANKLDVPEIFGLFGVNTKLMIRNHVKQWDSLYTEMYNSEFIASRIDDIRARFYVRENHHGVIDATILCEDYEIGCKSGTINAFIHAGFEIDGYTYFSHLAKTPGSKSVFNFLANVALIEHEQFNNSKLRLSCVDNETTSLAKYYSKVGFEKAKTVTLRDNLAWLGRESLFQAEIR